METNEIDAVRADFARHGCGGIGEYGRCHDMSEDYATLLAEVKRLTAERDEARAAHAALLADVEALRRTYRTADGWPMSLIAVDMKLAAVIAKHPTTKEARDE